MSRVTRACPVCAHGNSLPLHENRMAAVNHLDLSYTVCRCAACGFSFASPVADEATLARYYRSASKYDFATEISALDTARFEAATTLCDGIVPRDALVVDIGCGSGGLLSRFKAEGWSRLAGIDPAPEAAQRARELYSIGGVQQGTMADAPGKLPLPAAGLLCITAVLEHLHAPRRDVGALLAALSPGCRVLAEVPALEGFDGAAGEPFGEFSLEHIQYFSAASLQNLFASLGASPLRIVTVALPGGNCPSAFGLFEVSPEPGNASTTQREEPTRMERYIAESMSHWHRAIQRLPTAGDIALYGAGSHTARLLAAIESEPGRRVVAVFDANPNLCGKTIGRHAILPPEAVSTIPGIPIVVSSFKAQGPIAASLRQRCANPLVTLYE